MYTPASFIETDLAALDALATRDSFITLITVRDNLPMVSHLPVLYTRDTDRIQLFGHWARANPQSQHNGHAYVIFHGPHAYVSPSWYPDKEQQARVPTWNYAVAHLQGQLHTFEDNESLIALISNLSKRHETSVGQNWQFEPQREDHLRQLRGIIGFRFVVERTNLKFKLSQNHPLTNRQSVAEHLAAQSRESSRDIAQWMDTGEKSEPGS